MFLSKSNRQLDQNCMWVLSAQLYYEMVAPVLKWGSLKVIGWGLTTYVRNNCEERSVIFKKIKKAWLNLVRDDIKFISKEIKMFIWKFSNKLWIIGKITLQVRVTNFLIKAKYIVCLLSVVNDATEEVVKLVDDYNSILTKNEEQKQYTL